MDQTTFLISHRSVVCIISLERKRTLNVFVLKNNQKDFGRVLIVDPFGSATKAKFQTNQLCLGIFGTFWAHSEHERKYEIGRTKAHGKDNLMKNLSSEP